MTDAPKNAKLAAKERARAIRHAAYERQKELRAKDPRTLAMKEAAKKRRHEAYQAIKERRKASAAEKKSVAKKTDAADRAKQRATTARRLIERASPAVPTEVVPPRYDLN